MNPTSARTAACIALAMLSLSATFVCGLQPEAGVPRVTLPLLGSAPVVDGVIGEDEWAGAVRNVGFIGHGTRRMEPRTGVFWLGCDGTQLYVAVKSQLPPDGSLLDRAVPDPTRDDRGAFRDDSIELVLDPKRERAEGERTYYHLIVSPRGALYDLAIDPDNPRNPANLAWRIPQWSYANRATNGWWHVEAAIPLSSLDAGAADLDRTWGVRIARNWKRPYAQSQWESQSASYHDRPSMPLVRWSGDAPVVRVLGLHEEWARARIRVEVRNPHDHPLAVRVRLSDAWHNNLPVKTERVLELAPGAVETVELEAPDGGPVGAHRTAIDVSAPDGGTTYYFRDMSWSLHRPEELWTISDEARKAVNLQFKFYPTHDKVRLSVDLTGLPARDAVTGARAAIAGTADGASVLWEQKLSFTNHLAGGLFDIPTLPEGRYVLSVHLAGGGGVPDEPVTQAFVRRRFEWEGNALGNADAVMPPFSDLRVDGDTVESVLRRHRHGNGGLWSSVESDGRELLAGPMRWEVRAAAAEGAPAACPVAAEPWKAVSASATGVTGRARWTAGPVTAQVKTQYDYDGMMLVTLDLEPAGSGTLHELALDIPLRPEQARYMHAVGDGLRHNYAGFVPDGTGRVWDSSRGNKLEIVGTFYPYIWLGGGARGLCWFADTDRDWILDSDTPVIDVVRGRDSVRLRVRFVTKPTVLTRRHRIVFGLQATPTKPMPDGWRLWTGRKKIPGGRPVTWMGHTMYWGGTSYDVYPHRQDYTFFEKLREARETGAYDRQFLEQWMKILAETWEEGSPAHKRFLAHVRGGMHTAAHSRWEDGVRLFGYTNARGVGFLAPEFETFQDEWVRYGWFNRDWNPLGGIAYDISPSPSFVDFAVWHYRKMLMWTDGVYWDNIFLSAHYDPVVGNAWTDEAGRLHPGLGLFHLRNLIKRTAVMHWREGLKLPPSRRPLVTLSHMTNTQLVPVLSFGNCNMDWEWKYGYEDFQDRFPADLTVAESIGRQVGAWPTILAGGHPDPDDPRTARMWRTRLAVCLVHEIKHFDYRPRSDAELYGKLFEFGYGTPECTVYNYWEPPHPVRVDGVDARTLAMARGGSALVVVTDYGDGGTCALSVDPDVLGVDPEAAATDFESGEPVERVGPGRYRFELPKHDVKIVRVN